MAPVQRLVDFDRFDKAPRKDHQKYIFSKFIQIDITKFFLSKLKDTHLFFKKYLRFMTQLIFVV